LNNVIAAIEAAMPASSPAAKAAGSKPLKAQRLDSFRGGDHQKLTHKLTDHRQILRIANEFSHGVVGQSRCLQDRAVADLAPEIGEDVASFSIS
jgi:hypothetical protein